MFTVSNTQEKGALKPASLFLLFLFLLPNEGAFSQKINKHYTSTLQGNNTLYYILPQDGFFSKTHRSELTYDISFLSSEDSVTFNFSFHDRTERNIDSIELINGIHLKSEAKKIFYEPDKSRWHYRCSASFSFIELKSFFNHEGMPRIIIHSDMTPVELTIQTGDWKNQSANTGRILSMIVFNSQK